MRPSTVASRARCAVAARRRRPRSRRLRPPRGAGRSWPGAYRRPSSDQGLGVVLRRAVGRRRVVGGVVGASVGGSVGGGVVSTAVTCAAARSPVAWSGWCRPSCPTTPSRTSPTSPSSRGATCVLPSVSMVCLVAPSTFCSVTAALRVDELVHLAGEVVGAVHREVHAVARAHRDHLAVSSGRSYGEGAVGVGEQLVGVDVVHLRVALGHLLRHRVHLDHRGVRLLVLDRGRAEPVHGAPGADRASSSSCRPWRCSRPSSRPTPRSSRWCR